MREWVLWELVSCSLGLQQTVYSGEMAGHSPGQVGGTRLGCSEPNNPTPSVVRSKGR